MQSDSDTKVSIRKFLQIKDLEVLDDVYKKLGKLAQEDIAYVNKILSQWDDQQALANLLFYPDLITVNLREEVILRALTDENMPYVMLAAVVGLETLGAKGLSADWKETMVDRLVELIRSNSDVISARASVTIWEYLDDNNYAKFLHLYPVKDKLVDKNIMAFTLIKFDDVTRRIFKKNLKKISLKWRRRRRFLKRFKKFKQQKKGGDWVFMQAPLYENLPNLKDVDQALTCFEPGESSAN